MKKTSLQLLAVIRAIIAYCTNTPWSTIVASVPSFSSSISSLQREETIINELIQQQSKNITGSTDTRRSLRLTLAIVSYTYLRRGMAYSKSVNNMDLYKSLNYSLSTLKAMNFNTIGQTIQECYNNLIAVPIAALTPFGITSFVNWANAITTYNNYLSTPRGQVANKKAIGEMIEELLQDANNFMRTEITPQAQAFVQTEPLFVKGFMSNLKKMPIAILHTRLVAVVTDELGQPCINCKVTVDAFTKDGKTYKAVSATTDINGNCEVKGFESGIRTVTISGASIVAKTFSPFQFANGKAVINTFVCTPAFNTMPASKATAAKEKANS